MSWAIWITGRPGSGTSEVTREAAAQLRAAGQDVAVLELDELRRAGRLLPRTRRRARDRLRGPRGACRSPRGVAASPCSSTPPRIAARGGTAARALVPSFAEVRLECPVEVCREREAVRHGTHAPSGIYARAGRPGGPRARRGHPVRARTLARPRARHGRPRRGACGRARRGAGRGSRQRIAAVEATSRSRRRAVDQRPAGQRQDHARARRRRSAPRRRRGAGESSTSGSCGARSSGTGSRARTRRRWCTGSSRASRGSSSSRAWR